MSGQLPMWTVYDHPRDFPHCYVARKHVVDSQGSHPTDEIVVSADLEALRDVLEGMGLVKLMRSEQDEPVIIETWL